MLVNRWQLALFSQIAGLAIISFVAFWAGIIRHWMILVPLILIVLYTLLPYWFLESFVNKFSNFIVWCENGLSLDPKNDTVSSSPCPVVKLENIYIGILAICDLLVLCFLMIFTNGLESPFSPLLLTIPAVVYVLKLPFKVQLYGVFPLTLCGAFISAVLPYYFSFIASFSTFSTLCFSVVTIACIVVIFLQAWADAVRIKRERSA